MATIQVKACTTQEDCLFFEEKEMLILIGLIVLCEGINQEIGGLYGDL